MSDTLTAKGESLSFCFCLSPGLSSAAGPEIGTTIPLVAAGRSGLEDSFINNCSTLFCLLAGLGRLILRRHAHGLADFVHGAFRDLAGAGRTCLQNIPGKAGILLVFFTALLHRVEDFHQVIGGPALAFDAADSSGSATYVHLGNSFAVAEDFVQVSDRTYVGISGITAPHAGWISDHGL